MVVTLAGRSTLNRLALFWNRSIFVTPSGITAVPAQFLSVSLAAMKPLPYVTVKFPLVEQLWSPGAGPEGVVANALSSSGPMLNVMTAAKAMIAVNLRPKFALRSW